MLHAWRVAYVAMRSGQCIGPSHTVHGAWLPPPLHVTFRLARVTLPALESPLYHHIGTMAMMPTWLPVQTSTLHGCPRGPASSVDQRQDCYALRWSHTTRSRHFLAGARAGPAGPAAGVTLARNGAGSACGEGPRCTWHKCDRRAFQVLVISACRSLQGRRSEARGVPDVLAGL